MAKEITPSQEAQFDNASEKSVGLKSSEIKIIGARTSKEDYAQAASRVGGKDGKLYLPKAHGEYSGKTLFVTDTHLIQQVGRNVAIAHDLSKIDNKDDLLKLEEKGTLHKSVVKIKYSEEKGTSEIVPHNVQRANEVKKQAAEWAEKNLPNAKSRDTFMKHIETFTQDLSKGANQYQAAKTPPEKTPEQAQPQKAQPMEKAR